MLRKKSTVPPSIAEWYADETNYKELRDMVQSETFRRAVAHLRVASLPSLKEVGDESHNARQFCWLAGFTEFGKSLERLATPPPAKEQDLADEWEHITHPQQL